MTNLQVASLSNSACGMFCWIFPCHQFCDLVFWLGLSIDDKRRRRAKGELSRRVLVQTRRHMQIAPFHANSRMNRPCQVLDDAGISLWNFSLHAPFCQDVLEFCIQSLPWLPSFVSLCFGDCVFSPQVSLLSSGRVIVCTREIWIVCTRGDMPGLARFGSYVHADGVQTSTFSWKGLHFQCPETLQK